MVIVLAMLHTPSAHYGSLPVLATIFGLVAFALSAHSKAAENNLIKSTTLVAYSSMGIATGVLTLITLPVMYEFLSLTSESAIPANLSFLGRLLRGNTGGRPFSSTVVIELLWTCKS